MMILWRYKVNIFIITHKITEQLKCLICKENKIRLPIIFVLSIWILKVCQNKNLSTQHMVTPSEDVQTSILPAGTLS